MKRIAAVVALLALAACANAPERPGTYTTPQGSRWVISYVSSAASGSTRILVNGQVAASGSFGAIAGQRATGGGVYEGHSVTFTCSHRYEPVCLVYVDGEQAAELKYKEAP